MATDCAARIVGQKVAVVGGGLAGLMAARTLCRRGAKVTVYEARAQVGGRVLSDTTFAGADHGGRRRAGRLHPHPLVCAGQGVRPDADQPHEHRPVRRSAAQRETHLGRPLDMDEIRAIEKERSDRVLEPIARRATNVADAAQPWRDPGLRQFDTMSVASALQNFLGVRPTGPTARLWKATEHMLVNNNVARLEEMNFLGLLCLVKGGQSGTIGPPLMGYWDELEIYRCADGCQRLALEIAKEVHAATGCRVVRNQAVTRIDLPIRTGTVWIQSRNTRGREVDRRVDEKVSPLRLPYDFVVLAVPPSVWNLVAVTPEHPKAVVGLMRTGEATKFFSKVKGRFWIKEGAAPYGGSLDLGQVWEGTDNQTRVSGQDTVLSVFAGGPKRPMATGDFKRELTRLYRTYPDNVRKTLLVDWMKQPFIQAGYSAPGLGQIFTVGRLLNEPFLGRMFFAGERTQMDHFGYMEGAIRSGERAAAQLIKQLCDPAPQRSVPPDLRVAGGAPVSRAS